jgi:hypothetical protein
MADRAKKISELTALTSPSGDDLLVIVDDPSGNVATKKVTVNNFFNVANAVVVSANTLIVRNNQTPANSTITVTKGTIMYDTNYLYIATANNTLKRVSLSSF